MEELSKELEVNESGGENSNVGCGNMTSERADGLENNIIVEVSPNNSEFYSENHREQEFSLDRYFSRGKETFVLGPDFVRGERQNLTPEQSSNVTPEISLITSHSHDVLHTSVHEKVQIFSNLTSEGNDSVAEEEFILIQNPPSLSHLKALLLKIWLNESILEVQDVHLLTPLEKEVLSWIFSKKLPPKYKNKSIEYQLKSKQSLRNTKRKEEQLKFVIKTVIRSMISEFHTPNKGERKNLKLDNHLNFFSQFFEEVSKTKQIPLEAFLPPGTSGPSNSKARAKTFSSEYVSRLKLSEEFVSKFNAKALDLKKKSTDNIKVRIETLVDSLVENGHFESPKHNIRLPWTKREFENAFDLVRQEMIHKY